MNSDLSDLLTVAQAIALIDSLPVQPPQLQLPLSSAAGLRLAQDLKADRDDPPFDKSLMDGYAIRSQDLTAPPTTLKVVGESSAGQSSPIPLAPGQAIAIMTGAPIPAGADAVVPIEQTDSTTFAQPGTTIRVTAKPGRNISPRGSDIRKDALVLPTGTLLTPPRIAVAASVGATQLSVYDRPRCAVLGTGNEIVPADHDPGPNQIRNSNSPMLMTLLTKLGCSPRDLGICPDDPAAITRAIRDGLTDQVLFITGGMSMGRYDFVPRILTDLGGTLKITKLRIKPGKPFVLAQMPAGQYVIGLPGNPVSAFVCTIRLASRLLRRISGGKPDQHIWHLPLTTPISANGDREFYQPALITNNGIEPLPWKGSADIYTLARADALIIRPENAPPAPVGEHVPLIPLE
jgi:molybdopterin molybdotransferase